MHGRIRCETGEFEWCWRTSWRIHCNSDRQFHNVRYVDRERLSSGCYSRFACQVLFPECTLERSKDNIFVNKFQLFESCDGRRNHHHRCENSEGWQNYGLPGLRTSEKGQ